MVKRRKVSGWSKVLLEDSLLPSMRYLTPHTGPLSPPPSYFKLQSGTRQPDGTKLRKVGDAGDPSSRNSFFIHC